MQCVFIDLFTASYVQLKIEKINFQSSEQIRLKWYTRVHMIFNRVLNSRRRRKRRKKTHTENDSATVKNDQIELHICSTYVHTHTHTHKWVTCRHISALSLQIPFSQMLAKWIYVQFHCLYCFVWNLCFSCTHSAYCYVWFHASGKFTGILKSMSAENSLLALKSLFAFFSSFEMHKQKNRLNLHISHGMQQILCQCSGRWDC